MIDVVVGNKIKVEDTKKWKVFLSAKQKHSGKEDLKINPERYERSDDRLIGLKRIMLEIV